MTAATEMIAAVAGELIDQTEPAERLPAQAKVLEVSLSPSTGCCQG